MKKTLAFLLTLVMLVSTLTIVPTSVYADTVTPTAPEVLTYSAGYAGQPAGSGTKEDPYKIATADDLLWMSRQCAPGDATTSISDHNAEAVKTAKLNPFKDKYLVQTADIDLGGKVVPSIGMWNASYTEILVPTATEADKCYAVFGGTYDGQGYSISNGYTARVNPFKDQLELVAMVTSRGGHGLFGIIDGATIKNVNLKNFKLYTDDSQYISCAGLLVGIAIGDILSDNAHNLIENCTTDENCAMSYKGSTSRTTGNNDINVHGRMGGLVGSATMTTIRGCVNNADVTVGHSHAYVGGIVGSIIGGAVENCDNNGDVNIINAATATPTKRYRMFGGIVGGMPHAAADTYDTMIDGCVNTGTISTDVAAVTPYVAGGILGGTRRTAKLTLQITNCANLGNITTSAAADVACAEGAIIGAIQIWSSNRVTQPQTIDLRFTGIRTVALNDLTVTEKKLPDCLDGTDAVNNVVVVKMENDANTIAATWVNLGPTDTVDDNGVEQKNNYQQVVDACFGASDYKVDTEDNVKAAVAKLRKSATVYGIQKTKTDEKTTLRALAYVYDTDAKKIGVEIVNVKDGSVALVKETTDLYRTVIANGKTLKAYEGNYFAAIALDTAELDGDYEIRVYTVNADDTKTYRPAVKGLEFKRGELK